MKTLAQTIIISSIIVLSTQLHAVQIQLNGTEIMQKTLRSFYYQGQDQSAKAHMEIIDKQGRKRIREFSILRLNTQEVGGKQKYYVYFNKPSDVKKLVFMAWKNIGVDDDRWLYLPALDLVKRIGASDERTSFVGSHFYYEDVSGREVTEDSHELLEGTEQYYIVKSTPNTPESVVFSHYITHIDRTTMMPMKIDYYQNDNLYRQYQTLDTRKISGYTTVIKAQVDDKRSSGKTIIEYSSVTYDRGIPENIFSERYLRKAPKKYLK